MTLFFQSLLTASLQGSLIILTVLVLRRILQKTSKKMICFLWVLAFVRLLVPIQIESKFSLQPTLFSSLPDLPGQKWSIALGIVWIAVAACFAVYSTVSYLHMKQVVREAIKIHGGWLCDRIDTAFILGFLDPQIYIPMNVTPEERKHILEHERTHLDKGDLWLKMLGFVALALHWFNPLVWLAYFLYSKDIEMACDERVVQFMELSERKQYSRALLNCSTNKAHMAACPIAFGEVSVKERILFVLDYKRPGFWISLVTLLSIAFVAGCLMTSPAKFSTVQMSSEKLVAHCIEQVYNIQNSHHYRMHHERTVYFAGGENGEMSESGDFYRLNDDFLYDGTEATSGQILSNGIYARYWGDFWVKEDTRNITAEQNGLLDTASPDGKSISFPDGVHAIDDYTCAVDIYWQDAFGSENRGTFTYHFADDGTLSAIEMDYDHEGNRYVYEISFISETEAETRTRIDEIAAQVISQSQLTQLRFEAEMVTEVPSNKTSYDKNYAWGAGSNSYDFFYSEREYFFRLAAENPSPTGVTLVHNEASDKHTSLVAEEGYWLEEFVDNQWVLVPYHLNKAPLSPQNISVSWTGSDHYTVDWTNTYGQLDGGRYRIGREYTMTDEAGNTHTQVCYAKFRLYPANFDQLLKKCNNAMDALLNPNSPAVHFISTDWCKQVREEPEYRELHGMEHYIIFEIWRSGSACLKEQQYILKDDKSLKSHNGLLYRGGKYYDLTWAGANAENEVITWNSNTYADSFNFELALTSYILWDGRIENIREESNTIIVELSDDWEMLGFQYPYHREVVFTFDENDKLIGIKTYSVYGEYADDYELEAELVVYDTSEADITAMIEKQNLTTPNTFSWADDMANLGEDPAGKRTKNFVNNTPQTIRGPEDVIAIAIKDCTLSAAVGLEPGTNMSAAFYDPDAKMWKVEFTASWDDRIYQAVYLNEQGITQLTVQNMVE